MYPGERFNSISHLVGAVLALAGMVALIVIAARQGDSWKLVSFSVYGACLLSLYTSSTLYHSLRHRAKAVFRRLDHLAIYLLIAGTYTPFALGVLRDSVGPPLLAFVWSLAALGVAFTAITRVRYPTAFTLLVLAMGWTILVAIKPLWEHMDPWGLFWLGAGGAAYTGGIAFFAADRVRFGHLVWHVCVILGSACHYVAVLRYAG